MKNINWSLIAREDAEFIELLYKLTDGWKREEVTSEKDWKIMEGIINLFFTRFKSEAEEFIIIIKQLRQIKGSGYSKDREILHVASLPPRLHKLIKVCFPKQQFNKKFINDMIKRIPLLKVGNY